MAKYNGKNYSLSRARKEIGMEFWQIYRDDLFAYATDRNRTDILEKIHKEWTVGGDRTSFGTDIRIGWALAIYDHGDWGKSTSAAVIEYEVVKPKKSDTDRRMDYPAPYRCDNGVYVRSLSELCIANWLYFNKIPFEYEREVQFKSNGKTVLCDFYLPDNDVYIEFWGRTEDEKYISYMNWKESLYIKEGYKLVSLYLEDLKNLRGRFDAKLDAVKSNNKERKLC